MTWQSISVLLSSTTGHITRRKPLVADMSEGEPATKRLKTMTDTIVDVHAEGDTLLVVKGFAGIDKS